MMKSAVVIYLIAGFFVFAPPAHSSPDIAPQTVVQAQERGTNAANLVTRLYLEILHREPDRKALETYSGMIANGKNEAWLRDVLERSPEHNRQKIIARTQFIRLLRYITLAILVLAGSFLLSSVMRQPRVFPIMAVLVCGLSALLYFSWIIRYAVNIPSWDDFDAILAYLNSPPLQRLGHIFAVHNEHRITFTRLLAETSLVAFGRIDFKFMTLVTNSALLGIILIIWKAWSRDNIPRVYFLLIPLLVLNPLPWVNMMHPTQYGAALFFALASIYMTTRSRTFLDLFAGIVLAAVSTCTMASGILTFPVLLLAIFLLDFFKEAGGGYRICLEQTVILRFVATLLAFLAISFAYFRDYSVPAQHSQALLLLNQPFALLGYALTIVGSALGNGAVAATGGALVLVFFCYLTIAKFWRRSPVFYFMLLLLLVIALSGAVTRAGLGISALDNRYKEFSLLASACVLALLVQWRPRLFERRWVFAIAASALALAFVFSALDVLPKIREHRKHLVVGTSEWILKRHGLHYPREGMMHAGAIFDESVRNGVYQIPECVQSHLKKTEKTPGTR